MRSESQRRFKQSSRLAIALVALVACGCELGPRPLVGGGVDGWRRGDVLMFAPVSIDLNPSTRVEPVEGGGAEIVCQLICLDRWGHTVKAGGKVRLTLRVPGRADDRVIVWDVDLTDGEENARRYDPVTRAYRLRLTGLAPWASEALVTEGGVGDGLELEAVFMTTGPDGNPVALEDRLSIRPVAR